MKKKEMQEKLIKNMTESMSKVSKENISADKHAELVGKEAAKGVMMYIKEGISEEKEKKKIKKEKWDNLKNKFKI